MNYLAHIFLSGSDSKVQIGNFVGDAVKGRAYLRYPEQMQQGMLLHRKIDEFADSHPLFREAVYMGRSSFGRYSGVVTDLFFDYLLARHFRQYSSRSLPAFARRFYWALLLNYRYLPERFQRFIWHFIITNRLVEYASAEGLRRSLEIMTEYRGLQIDPCRAVTFLADHQESLWDLFSAFFPEIQNMCQRELVRPTTQMLNS